jgi:hypothetical protein
MVIFDEVGVLLLGVIADNIIALSSEQSRLHGSELAEQVAPHVVIFDEVRWAPIAAFACAQAEEPKVQHP